MTRLASITNNHLALTCVVCGHSRLLPVATLINHLGKYATVQHAVSKCRCSRCKALGKAEFRIVFVGGSDEAMLGGKQTPDPKPDGKVF